MLHATSWFLAGHVIGIIFWIAGLMSVYWLQRMHVHATADQRDKFTAMERSLALVTDLAATLAMVTGVVMLFHPFNMFSLPKMGWLHAKLAFVVLGLLPLHGMMRARVGKFSRGGNPDVPQWQWSALLVVTVAIVIFVITRFQPTT
jgi:putative membrane protein